MLCLGSRFKSRSSRDLEGEAGVGDEGGVRFLFLGVYVLTLKRGSGLIATPESHLSCCLNFPSICMGFHTVGVCTEGLWTKSTGWKPVPKRGRLVMHLWGGLL